MNNPKVSRGNYRKFFSSLGFDDNPFAHTNADDEDRLPDYFVSPPYFSSVFGDPKTPKSFVVFAPRGGGKSAQRRMIERECSKNQVLSITYDRFDFPAARKVSNISLHDHLRRIIRFVLMGILVTLNSEPKLRKNLLQDECDTLVKLTRIYLVDVTDALMQESLNSLKSLKEKMRDFWNEWRPLANMALSALLKKTLGVDPGSLSTFSQRNITSADLKYQLQFLVNIVKKVGYQSLYILVDRVDESALTGNDAVASFNLLKPLLRDLDLLEMDGLGFKFFLWNQLESLYEEIARPDRIRQESLDWKDEMLRNMWRKRMHAYSQGKVNGLNCLSETVEPYPPDDLALIFAQRSPRDMIRIGAQIMTEQMEINSSATKITSRAVYQGIEKFCSQRVGEIFSSSTLRDLKKVQQVDFTIPYLANQIFREKQSTTRNRLLRWRREGVIVDGGRVNNPNPQQPRPIKLMAIADVRIAKVMFPQVGVSSFLQKKYKKCPRCESVVLRDWDDDDSLSICHNCQFDLLSDEDGDILDKWQRESFAKESRRNKRKEQVQGQQLPLFDDDTDTSNNTN